jgi:N-acetylglucosamine malate deacetylase 1
MGNILVLSPHPDDDAIGCGGVIVQHVVSGDRVEVAYLTSGEHGGHGRSPGDTITVREQEAANAGKILGIHHIEFWQEPDGNLQPTDENVNHLIIKIRNLKPEILYVTHRNEEHPDHRAAARLVELAFRNLRSLEKPVVWAYEIWTPIQKIHHIIDISDHVETKMKAVQAHKSQCSVLRFDEAILGLNRYRGEMHSWPGGPYAEVFTSLEISG